MRKLVSAEFWLLRYWLLLTRRMKLNQFHPATWTRKHKTSIITFMFEVHRSAASDLKDMPSDSASKSCLAVWSKSSLLPLWKSCSHTIFTFLSQKIFVWMLRWYGYICIRHKLLLHILLYLTVAGQQSVFWDSCSGCEIPTCGKLFLN